MLMGVPLSSAMAHNVLEKWETMKKSGHSSFGGAIDTKNQLEYIIQNYCKPNIKAGDNESLHSADSIGSSNRARSAGELGLQDIESNETKSARELGVLNIQSNKTGSVGKFGAENIQPKESGLAGEPKLQNVQFNEVGLPEIKLEVQNSQSNEIRLAGELGPQNGCSNEMGSAEDLGVQIIQSNEAGPAGELEDLIAMFCKMKLD
ncbi:hypothetical protein BDQ17DRAFT_847536 [Cyathus striatus]|nr:hypothetical protein BDQ17DRAFT_847536 [Cyathus striatus]